MSRIGTLGIGRIGGINGLGQDECPTGFFLDPVSGAVCLPITVESTGNLPVDTGVVPTWTPPTPSLPPITTTPAAPYVGLPVSLPPVYAPSGVSPSPGVGLSTPVTCPAGYKASGGVCVPAATTTLIPGVPDWVLYSGIGLMAFVVFSGTGRGRR